MESSLLYALTVVRVSVMTVEGNVRNAVNYFAEVIYLKPSAKAG